MKKPKKCKYHPCHDVIEDCTFCFCLIYPCELTTTGGRFILRKSDNTYIWDCSKCNTVHSKEFINALKKEFTKLIEKESYGTASSCSRNK